MERAARDPQAIGSSASSTSAVVRFKLM